MSEWITDRRPTAEDACKDADPVLYECVIVQGRDYKKYRKWYNVTSGEAWQCIPWENADEPIAKAKRRTAMSDWITDRRPTEDDADYEKCVWTMCAGAAVLWGYGGIRDGQPWMPTNRPKPYVKPKRWEAKWNGICWSLYYVGEWQDSLIHFDCNNDEVREAAERIAAIYEEVMP